MTFSSLTFLIFFAVAFAAYWLIRQRRWQNLLLVLVSYIFYGWWDWRFSFLMLASSLIDYVLGGAIERTENSRRRGLYLTAALVSQLSLLAFFKYYNFFVESFAQAAASLGWNPGDLTLQIILPVGISFYTFQTLSYTIDIYRRQLKASTDLVEYLAFVSFFPQLVAGPIERAVDLLPQFGKDRHFDPQLAADGLRQMLWGLFKKLAVADRLALIVAPAYEHPENYTGTHLAFATVCFAFQIYCDFSGYSDIAVGVARQFGIRLSRNFAYPYFSQSIGEFWRRWHISLSTWFRDYVYIPLGGSRGSSLASKRNLLTTFLVSGLWHGAAWGYVVWGAFHGVLASIYRGSSKSSPRDVPGNERWIPRPMTVLRMALTFSLVCLGWVFFRAATWSDAMEIHRRIFNPSIEVRTRETVQLYHFVLTTPGVLATTVVLFTLVMIEWCGRRHDHPLAMVKVSRPLRWAAYSVMLWATLLLIPEGAGQEFIYFAF
jgi:alginate O-acetyltransferase complex protein AlgI